VLTRPSEKFKGNLNVDFENPYRLNGDWEMAVTSLSYSGNFPLFVLCDLVGYSHVNNNKVQYLDFFDNVCRNSNPRYVKVIKKRFQSINVDIRHSLSDETISSDGEVICVLHIRKA
jgi:hypothetical protein